MDVKESFNSNSLISQIVPATGHRVELSGPGRRPKTIEELQNIDNFVPGNHKFSNDDDISHISYFSDASSVKGWEKLFGKTHDNNNR
eukprot:UN01560